MKRQVKRKLLLSTLGIVFFAKAATSVPLLPIKPDLSFGQQDLVLAAAVETKEEPEEEIPAVVEGLEKVARQCETPEEVLYALSLERDTIDLQKKDLAREKSKLALAKEKLEIEKASLGELKSSINDLLARIEAQQNDDLKRLIEFYKNMKPTDAARIIDELDIETTIMVLGTMQPRIAAPILAKMSPVRARAVSRIILERSQLPGDQDLVGIRLN